MRQVTGHADGARRVALLTLGLLVVLLFEQAPHFVHHLFEPGQLGAECVFAVGAEHTHAIAGETVSVAAPHAAEPARPGSAPAGLISRVWALAGSRAPPPVSS